MNDIKKITEKLKKENTKLLVDNFRTTKKNKIFVLMENWCAD